MEMTFQGILHGKSIANMTQHVEGRIHVIAPLYETETMDLEKYYPANLNVELLGGDKVRGELRNARFASGAANVKVTKDGTFLHVHLQSQMGKTFRVPDDLVGEKLNVHIMLIETDQPDLVPAE